MVDKIVTQIKLMLPLVGVNAERRHVSAHQERLAARLPGA